MQIQGSNAIMVGGASGMCRATAERFVARGGKVAILDLERSDGANVAKSLGGTFHPCNVMDHAGIEQVIGLLLAEVLYICGDPVLEIFQHIHHDTYLGGIARLGGDFILRVQ